MKRRGYCFTMIESQVGDFHYDLRSWRFVSSMDMMLNIKGEVAWKMTIEYSGVAGTDFIMIKRWAKMANIYITKEGYMQYGTGPQRFPSDFRYWQEIYFLQSTFCWFVCCRYLYISEVKIVTFLALNFILLLKYFMKELAFHSNSLFSAFTFWWKNYDGYLTTSSKTYLCI